MLYKESIYTTVKLKSKAQEEQKKLEKKSGRKVEEELITGPSVLNFFQAIEHSIVLQTDPPEKVPFHSAVSG